MFFDLDRGMLVGSSWDTILWLCKVEPRENIRFITLKKYPGIAFEAIDSRGYRSSGRFMTNIPNWIAV
jgi:hypothetical protein